MVVVAAAAAAAAVVVVVVVVVVCGCSVGHRAAGPWTRGVIRWRFGGCGGCGSCGAVGREVGLWGVGIGGPCTLRLRGCGAGGFACVRGGACPWLMACGGACLLAPRRSVHMRAGRGPRQYPQRYHRVSVTKRADCGVVQYGAGPGMKMQSSSVNSDQMCKGVWGAKTILGYPTWVGGGGVGVKVLQNRKALSNQ